MATKSATNKEKSQEEATKKTRLIVTHLGRTEKNLSKIYRPLKIFLRFS